MHGSRTYGHHPDAVVVGSGLIGAACVEALTRRGVRVLVLDRRPVASATTASGEGNLLVSDKPPGPELDLALASLRRWPALLAELREEIGARRASTSARAGSSWRSARRSRPPCAPSPRPSAPPASRPTRSLPTRSPRTSHI